MKTLTISQSELEALDEPVYVLAGYRHQFVRWAREKGLNPHDRKTIRYISMVNNAHGIHPKRLVRVGTFWENPDYEELLFILTQHGETEIYEDINIK